MTIRLTRQRVALAGLFLLAGVGLASLLSPLIGTALATVGQTVNISDKSAAANFAKVTPAGELKTIGTVTGGNVYISAPQSAFNFPALSFTDNLPEPQFSATNATLAFTGFRIAAPAVGTVVAMYQFGETSTT